MSSIWVIVAFYGFFFFFFYFCMDVMLFFLSFVNAKYNGINRWPIKVHESVNVEDAFYEHGCPLWMIIFCTFCLLQWNQGLPLRCLVPTCTWKRGGNPLNTGRLPLKWNLYSLNTAILLPMGRRVLVKSSALCREYSAFWDAAPCLAPVTWMKEALDQF